MITTMEILARLQAACAADAALLQAVGTLFGADATLTLQLGSNPAREVTNQDCPLIAFLDGGPSETGPHSDQWTWPLELQCYVCDGDVTPDADAPTGTVLLTAAGPVALDTLAAAVRSTCLTALTALGLTEDGLRIEIEPPSPVFWPRQRAIITLTAVSYNCLGSDPVLPALPET